MLYFDASLIKFVKADIFHYAIYRNINKQLFIITDYQLQTQTQTETSIQTNGLCSYIMVSDRTDMAKGFPRNFPYFATHPSL